MLEWKLSLDQDAFVIRLQEMRQPSICPSYPTWVFHFLVFSKTPTVQIILAKQDICTCLLSPSAPVSLANKLFYCSGRARRSHNVHVGVFCFITFSLLTVGEADFISLYAVTCFYSNELEFREDLSYPCRLLCQNTDAGRRVLGFDRSDSPKSSLSIWH